MAVNLPRRRTVNMAARRFNSSCQLQIAVDVESYCLKRTRGRYHSGEKILPSTAFIRCAECLLLAQSGHRDRAAECPLLGVKRTSVFQSAMSAFDPKRTWVAKDCCPATLPLNPIPPPANPCCNRIIASQ